jgi:hypothetical protein
VERFLEFGDVAAAEAVDVKLNRADNLAMIGGYGSHIPAPSI